MDAIVVDRDPPSIHNLTISPYTRASLLFALIAEIVVTHVEEEQHDLALLFFAFRPPIFATLQRLVPEIVDVSLLSQMLKLSSGWLQPPSGRAQRPI